MHKCNAFAHKICGDFGHESRNFKRLASKIPIMFQNSLGLRDNDAHDVPVRVVTEVPVTF